MKIYLYLEEYHVYVCEKGFLKTRKFINRKLLGESPATDNNMTRLENKFKHLIYWNEIRCFKFTWHINKK